MDFTVPNRVHIMPVGYEKDRVYESALRLKADKVILIGHTEDETEDIERIKALEDQLEDHGVEVLLDECDIFDLYDSLGIIGELIMEHEDDDIYVNVSTGSKVTAIAGIIACMAIDATPYYAKAKSYSGEYPEEIDFVQQLPRYPIDAPDQQQVEMLYVIYELADRELSATKGNLIHIGQHLGMPFLKEMNADDKGAYRALDSEIIQPLEMEGYISISQEGRNKVVSLTDEGSNALRAFRYLVKDSIKECAEEVISSERIN